ncbi:hypothetical protein CIG75_11510 [Tumebacillus algifaecis]|uniref:Adenylyltransferase AadA C-terminal domain-containing protein n=1 Tax=Tumebacillus algifaecis TaxID=1214604 RepID=A0A223D1W9_9BACL|nr:aminoglycoside adenylyltransferase domain-containing protein [Tumebacillus algifaecis]ASS75551.1 hypothetical protein CIG75_11510 [Tumebacillus algifaecis]
MTCEIPTALQPLIAAYTCQLNNASFRDALHGIYLYGSIALGAFDEQRSDIDFLTVLRRDLTEAERGELELLHIRLQNDHPLAFLMDGMYIHRQHLGRLNPEIPPYSFTHEGEFHRAGHWDVNHVTWWLLQHRAVTVFGPESSTLLLHVTTEDLRATMAYNLHSYWSHRLQALEGMSFDTLPETELQADTADAVLTLCRIAYTLEHGDILSKTAALQYAIQSSDAKWQPLFRETLRIRENTEASNACKSQSLDFPSVIAFACVACDFIRTVIDTHPQKSIEGGTSA